MNLVSIDRDAIHQTMRNQRNVAKNKTADQFHNNVQIKFTFVDCQNGGQKKTFSPNILRRNNTQKSLNDLFFYDLRFAILNKKVCRLIFFYF